MTRTPDLQALADSIAGAARAEPERGKAAAYIPELADADLSRFGIAIAPLGGEVVTAGDADLPFSIQSISKVFSLTLALERAGAALWSRVGREPSGDPFNSIVQLEREHGIPRNPFINAGAIVVADVLLSGRRPAEAVEEILGLCRRLAGDDRIAVNETVAASETRTGDRNRALAYFMRAEGNLRGMVDEVLAVYFRQCAVEMSCRQLAMAGRVLASTGQPDGGEAWGVAPVCARQLNALMMTCGTYDAAGEFAFRIGLPAKSGVGGGILGIVPRIASVAAWSPGLDAKGNSVLATRALREVARATGWSVFAPPVPDLSAPAPVAPA